MIDTEKVMSNTVVYWRIKWSNPGRYIALCFDCSDVRYHDPIDNQPNTLPEACAWCGKSNEVQT